MIVQVLVLAKTPLPGMVKTRLRPPCTPQQAAQIADAALADTLAAVTATPGVRRCLVIEGAHPAPSGWSRKSQQGTTLGERLAHAYADTWIAGAGSLLIGMDTPQVSAALLTATVQRLGQDDTDAVLGLAEDGGWWALGLRDPGHAAVLRDVPTSTSETGALTRAALQARGLRVAELPTLRDVDTATDARAVAALCAADSRFALTVATLMPSVTTS